MRDERKQGCSLNYGLLSAPRWNCQLSSAPPGRFRLQDFRLAREKHCRKSRESNESFRNPFRPKRTAAELRGEPRPGRSTRWFLAESPADIKYRRSETREMVADLCAVEPHSCSKLCFVDAKNGDTLRIGDFERAAIPEPVAILPRHSCVVDDGGSGKFSLTDSVLNQHSAVELVHLRKCWFGRMRQSRHGSFMFP